MINTTDFMSTLMSISTTDMSISTTDMSISTTDMSISTTDMSISYSTSANAHHRVESTITDMYEYLLRDLNQFSHNHVLKLYP